MSENTTTIEEMPEAKVDGILRKVQGLLAKAEHPNTGEAEAEAFRAEVESGEYPGPEHEYSDSPAS